MIFCKAGIRMDPSSQLIDVEHPWIYWNRHNESHNCTVAVSPYQPTSDWQTPAVCWPVAFGSWLPHRSNFHLIAPTFAHNNGGMLGADEAADLLHGWSFLRKFGPWKRLQAGDCQTNAWESGKKDAHSAAKPPWLVGVSGTDPKNLPIGPLETQIACLQVSPCFLSHHTHNLRCDYSFYWWWVLLHWKALRLHLKLCGCQTRAVHISAVSHDVHSLCHSWSIPGSQGKHPEIDGIFLWGNLVTFVLWGNVLDAYLHIPQ